jgi:hypothetical protein
MEQWEGKWTTHGAYFGRRDYLAGVREVIDACASAGSVCRSCPSHGTTNNSPLTRGTNLFRLDSGATRRLRQCRDIQNLEKSFEQQE